ncbi:hypothetical protein [Lacisediminihabitans sp.]|uniref:hypothetical protein n=1 Tax=Lacisediminihabitans sp. TaxID=2787631 RepID=UPI00374C8FCA
MRRLLPPLALVLIAPLVAELLAGSTPLAQPVVLGTLLAVYLPLYGAGALLIRELVVRSGRGWPSVLLLGVAYGLVEEGFASQSLFNPVLYNAADWGVRLLGVNGVFTESVLLVHAIWSAAVPIALVNVLFPSRRSTPYLGRVGLAVTAAFYLLGVAMLVFVARTYFSAGYVAPPALPLIALLAAAILGVVALRLVPRSRPLTVDPRPAPHPVVVFLLVAGCTFAWQLTQFLWAIAPAFGEWPLSATPLVAAIAFGGVVGWLLSRWSRSAGWGDRHLLAAAGAAIVAHTVIGVLVAPEQPDRIALVALGIAVAAALAWLGRGVATRSRQSAMTDVTVTP